MRQELFASFATRKSHPLAYRKVQLLQFAFMIQGIFFTSTPVSTSNLPKHPSDNLEPFQRALFADLGRPPLEATFLELGQMISDALTAYKKVDSWAKPDGVPFDIKTFLMRPHVRKVPKGVVLIIGPFNYPLWSMLGPMVCSH
jgi:aldehyde dehydrogenase (NAD+)